MQTVQNATVGSPNFSKSAHCTLPLHLGIQTHPEIRISLGMFQPCNIQGQLLLTMADPGFLWKLWTRLLTKGKGWTEGRRGGRVLIQFKLMPHYWSIMPLRLLGSNSAEILISTNWAELSTVERLSMDRDKFWHFMTIKSPPLMPACRPQAVLFGCWILGEWVSWCVWYTPLRMNPTPPTSNTQIILPVLSPR